MRYLNNVHARQQYHLTIHKVDRAFDPFIANEIQQVDRPTIVIENRSIKPGEAKLERRTLV